VTLLISVVIIGTAWFWFAEHWSFLDALEQTVTTVTTVGLGEVRPFDDTAQIFAIFLSIVGVSAGLFTLGAVFEEQIEDTLDRYGRRRMDRRIGKLADHVVLCGYGRVGTHVAELLSTRGVEIVVVDIDERLVALAADAGHAVVEGSSTEDDILRAAGIERAATVIVSVGDDAVGISTVLSARALNPKLRIIARANEASTEAKLKRAGCDRVVNPLQQGAQRMAAFTQQPDVADFLDVVVHDEDVEYRLEELAVTTASWFAGRTLGDAHIRRETGALVLAVRMPDGSFVSNPRPEVNLAPGITLIAIGTSEQLRALGRMLKVETPEA
jgi:voltage-gated potassium channel